MNKTVFPALLAATIMVAGAFAFMPVEQASTVHVQTIAAIAENGATLLREVAQTYSDAETVTLSCDADYLVTGITLDVNDGELTGDDDSVLVTMDGDRVADVFIVPGPNAILDGLEAADANTDTILDFDVTGDGADFISTALRISVQSDGDCLLT